MAEILGRVGDGSKYSFMDNEEVWGAKHVFALLYDTKI
jgi:hypothetical protein